MSNVIQLVHSEDGPRVDSRVITAQLSVKHGSSIRLIDRYADRFSRYGVLRFEIEKPRHGSKGGRPVRHALLTEDQCYFLLSLSRNTERVVELKADLVAAFSEARRRGHTEHLSLWQQLMALEVEDKASAVKGSFGSRLMNDRKVDLRRLRPRRRALEHELQPQLALVS